MTKIEQTGVVIKRLGGFSRIERAIGRLCHLIPVWKMLAGIVLVNLVEVVFHVVKVAGTSV